MTSESNRVENEPADEDDLRGYCLERMPPPGVIRDLFAERLENVRAVQMRLHLDRLHVEPLSEPHLEPGGDGGADLPRLDQGRAEPVEPQQAPQGGNA